MLIVREQVNSSGQNVVHQENMEQTENQASPQPCDLVTCPKLFSVGKKLCPEVANTVVTTLIKIFGSEYFRIFYSANWTCHKVASSLILILLLPLGADQLNGF